MMAQDIHKQLLTGISQDISWKAFESIFKDIHVNNMSVLSHLINSNGNSTLDANIPLLSSTTFQQNLLQINNPFVIAMTLSYLISFIVSIVGNATLIYVLLKNRRTRSQTRVYLIHLAMCDILVSLCCIPFSVSQIIYKNWIYGDVVCRGFVYFQAVIVSTSIFTLTSLSLCRSVDCASSRFLDLLIHDRHSTRFHWRVFAVIWILGYAIAIPLVLVAHERRIVGFELRNCREDWTRLPGLGQLAPQLAKIGYGVILLVFLYLVPLIIIVSAYRRICLRVVRVTKRRCEITNSHDDLKKRRRILRLSMMLISLFAFAWLPVHLIQLGWDIHHYQSSNSKIVIPIVQKLRHIFLWLALNNSAVNPIFIFFTDSIYQRSLRQCFQKCCGRKRRRRGPIAFAAGPRLEGKNYPVLYQADGRNNGLVVITKEVINEYKLSQEALKNNPSTSFSHELPANRRQNLEIEND